MDLKKHYIMGNESTFSLTSIFRSQMDFSSFNMPYAPIYRLNP